MASRTYPVRALVLRRTKLGESDVICTLLSSDGSQIRAVAKGARKPSSSFASRLEVYSVCDLLLVEGKSLDIVKEARLVEANAHLRSDIDLMEAAAPMVELLDKTTQVGLEDARLFPMACAALQALKGCATNSLTTSDDSDAEPIASAAVFTSAHLLKALAVLGFRPRFDVCVGCGAPIAFDQLPQRVSFSLVDGGLVCGACRSTCETISLSRDTVVWAQALLFSTFAEIKHFDMDKPGCMSELRFLQMWIRQHLGIKLKSLDYLVSNGISR